MSGWHYLRIKITPDPILEQNNRPLYNNIDVDLLTWRSMLTHALGQLYGLLGEASHFDVLVKQTQKPAVEAVVRIQEADVHRFCTSLLNYSCCLSDYLGQEYPVSAYARVVDRLPFLGVVVDETLVRV
ncbi:hypothetical protein METBIDRAFT_43253 [Metschnikowia bicuspidata var. bicuspidata NRRL YB-4993]|uniref:Ribonucleases P/MRP subunit Pop8-like domain-containing protein n=1 Tax=Metschnikowia bicuspidata var. bicuspidata NRRL YB-4993 TaxID=869754 RepID=A0A1A0H9H6_9ASCO|nr:hypothetical protein METBIDRAFT_43253 [Metschnikowia bicuspidata var. bicuspidata NRRL YB-4993]OBA20645.1 hypothetical protein METBIDRAFT_43253 [Metschnikowia bicuspidata var. bicuspidata NRRL YB-4993]